jgi:hypothetical protein
MKKADTPKRHPVVQPPAIKPSKVKQPVPRPQETKARTPQPPSRQPQVQLPPAKGATKMTVEDASRIYSVTAETGDGSVPAGSFAARAMRAAMLSGPEATKSRKQAAK